MNTSYDIALSCEPQNHFGYKSTLVRAITISWTNPDPDPCCYMALLCHNELNKHSLFEHGKQYDTCHWHMLFHWFADTCHNLWHARTYTDLDVVNSAFVHDVWCWHEMSVFDLSLWKPRMKSYALWPYADLANLPSVVRGPTKRNMHPCLLQSMSSQQGQLYHEIACVAASEKVLHRSYFKLIVDTHIAPLKFASILKKI